MKKADIKLLLKAHCTFEFGRYVFKGIDMDAACEELEEAFKNNLRGAGVIIKQDLNPHFIKTINSIEKSLKRR